MPDDVMLTTRAAADVPDCLTARIIDAIQNVYDPEIPVNIWELGLIYRIDPSPDGDVEIDMTLTTPACPSAQELPGMVELMVTSVDGVRSCTVNVVWEPTWTPDRMSEAAQLELGMM